MWRQTFSAALFSLFLLAGAAPVRGEDPDPALRDYLLGVTADPQGLDFNQDGAVDLADLIYDILGFATPSPTPSPSSTPAATETPANTPTVAPTVSPSPTTLPGSISRLSHLGGSITQVYVKGNVAYGAEFNKFSVYDLTDPLAPAYVTSLPFDVRVGDIQASPDPGYVYASLGNAGLAVVNVTSPLAPTLERIITVTSASFGPLKVDGSRIYAGVGFTLGFMILDATNPTQPTVIGSVKPPGTPSAVTVAGQYAYVLDSSGLRVINVSNPQAPSIENNISVSFASDVLASGNRLYLSLGAPGFRIFDITSPAQPAEITTFDVGVASDMAISGSNLIIGSGSAEISIVSLADEMSPAVLSEFTSEGRILQDLWLDGTRLVGGFGGGGIRVFDVSTPAAPVPQGAVPALGDIIDVAIAGDHAYAVVDSAGFEVLDVSDPTNPARIARYPFPEAGHVVVSGNRAYISGGDLSISSGTDILDISSPTAPTQIGHINFDSGPLALVGSTLYIADFSFSIYDVSDPANPTELGSTSLGGSNKWIQVAGTHAYVIDSGGDLRVLDVSDPANPAQVGSFPDAGRADLALSGTTAYAANEFDGFNVINVSNPAAPSLIQNLPVDFGFGVGVAAAGNFLVTANFSQIDAYNATDPADLQQLAGFRALTFGPLRLSGSDIYICGGSGGLEILRYTGPNP